MNMKFHRGGRGTAQTKKPSVWGVQLFFRTTQAKLVNSYQLNLNRINSLPSASSLMVRTTSNCLSSTSAVKGIDLHVAFF